MTSWAGLDLRTRYSKSTTLKLDCDLFSVTSLLDGGYLGVPAGGFKWNTSGVASFP